MPAVDALYLGAAVVDKVYLGSDVMWPVGTPSTYELTFGGNTYISISGISLDIRKAHEIRYIYNHTSGMTADEMVWGNSAPGSGGLSNYFLVKKDGNNHRSMRGGGGQMLSDIPKNYGTDIYFKEDSAPGAGPVVSAGFDDTYSDWTAKNTWNHRTGIITNLYIGQSGGVGGFRGVIKEFKIYDENDALIHYWKINDGRSTIVDSVGGVNGTLTIGSGSWTPIGGGGGAGIYIGALSTPSPASINSGTPSDTWVTEINSGGPSDTWTTGIDSGVPTDTWS